MSKKKRKQKASPPAAHQSQAPFSILPEETQSESQRTLHQVSVQHQGPIPSPVVLQQYEDIIPGAAERILQMAEQDATHQHDMHRKALDAQRREVRRGQILGFGIGIAALGSCLAALFLGHPTTAGIIGGTTVVGLVTVFVKGHGQAPQEK